MRCPLYHACTLLLLEIVWLHKSMVENYDLHQLKFNMYSMKLSLVFKYTKVCKVFSYKVHISK